jgi:hypothetical protein
MQTGSTILRQAYPDNACPWEAEKSTQEDEGG